MGGGGGGAPPPPPSSPVAPWPLLPVRKTVAPPPTWLVGSWLEVVVRTSRSATFLRARRCNESPHSTPTRPPACRRATHAAAPLGVSNRSKLTVGPPELKPPCARDHARSARNLSTARNRLSYFPPCKPLRRVAALETVAAARWQARKTRRGAARRVEPVEAHRGFPRAQHERK